MKVVMVVIVIVLAVVVTGILTRLPDNSQRVSSQAISDGESTTLGQAFKAQLKDHAELSGVYMFVLPET